MSHEPDLEWHAIRPWSRRFSMQIREVTSVSVTFILRSSMGASHNEALMVLGSESDEDDERMPTIADELRRGLAVKVNGNSWKRVIVHVDEDEEEAVVIVYGLVPRKKYEICLGVVAQDEPLQETVLTKPAEDEPATVDVPPEPTNEYHVMEYATSPSTLTPPTTPIRGSPPRAVTQEERVTQLRKQLALLTAERDDLSSQLKAARRESQRTETTLKSEIETLKRASEKHASGEHRSRQKILALQEAVKQASAAAEDIEELVRQMEEEMPGLNARAQEVEVEHKAVKDEAEARNAEVDSAIQVDKKMVADLQGELRSVCARLEKVTGKQEKLEKEVVPQLEERLLELRKELGEMEQETGEYDSQAGNEEGHVASRNARTWVSPIQRPFPTQRGPFAGYTPSTSLNTAPSSVAVSPHPNSLRSPQLSTSNFTGATLPLILSSSYDPQWDNGMSS